MGGYIFEWYGSVWYWGLSVSTWPQGVSGFRAAQGLGSFQPTSTWGHNFIRTRIHNRAAPDFVLVKAPQDPLPPSPYPPCFAQNPRGGGGWSNKAVCRTAPATPSGLNITLLKEWFTWSPCFPHSLNPPLFSNPQSPFLKTPIPNSKSTIGRYITNWWFPLLVL